MFLQRRGAAVVQVVVSYRPAERGRAENGRAASISRATVAVDSGRWGRGAARRRQDAPPSDGDPLSGRRRLPGARRPDPSCAALQGFAAARAPNRAGRTQAPSGAPAAADVALRPLPRGGCSVRSLSTSRSRAYCPRGRLAVGSTCSAHPERDSRRSSLATTSRISSITAIFIDADITHERGACAAALRASGAQGVSAGALELGDDEQIG